MVDGLWHTAPGTAAPLASLASLDPAVCGHPTPPQLVGPNKGPDTEEHGTTVNPAMLAGDSTRFVRSYSGEAAPICVSAHRIETADGIAVFALESPCIKGYFPCKI